LGKGEGGGGGGGGGRGEKERPKTPSPLPSSNGFTHTLKQNTTKTSPTLSHIVLFFVTTSTGSPSFRTSTRARGLPETAGSPLSAFQATLDEPI